MNTDDTQRSAPSVEQSWIVLDDQGWLPSSRPPTASPSRPSARATPFQHDDDDDEEDNGPQNQVRRLGMDRDVREALELAERSLELAGSVDEFFAHQSRTGLEDDGFGTRSSPSTFVNRAAVGPDESEDRYNGRGPPVIKRSIGGISTDSEHIAFRNVKSVTPLSKSADDDAHGLSNSLEEHRETPQPRIIQSVAPKVPPRYSFDNEQEEDGGIFQWIFGLQSNASIFPLLVSHSITLLAGFYLGYRRISYVQHHSSASSTAPTGVATVGGSQ